MKTSVISTGDAVKAYLPTPQQFFACIHIENNAKFQLEIYKNKDTVIFFPNQVYGYLNSIHIAASVNSKLRIPGLEGATAIKSIWLYPDRIVALRASVFLWSLT